MAIDTAEKRRAIVGINYPYYASGVTPNASKDEEWRQQAGHGYSGIAAAAASVSAVIKKVTDLVGTHDVGKALTGKHDTGVALAVTLQTTQDTD